MIVLARHLAVAVVVLLTNTTPVVAEANLTNEFCPVLPTEKAVSEYHLEHHGRTVYFCCESCIEKFRSNPAAYLEALPPVEPVKPSPTVGAEESWQWWDLVYQSGALLGAVDEHRLLAITLGLILVLALATRVRRRVRKGITEPSRIAWAARACFRPFLILMILAFGGAADYVFLNHWDETGFQFVERHQLVLGITTVVVLLGMLAYLLSVSSRLSESRIGGIVGYVGRPVHIFLILSIGTGVILWRENQAALASTAAAQARVTVLESAVANSAPKALNWAWPQGFHSLPKGIKNSYYRGNDERSDKLFNNGNYRTATFHVSVREADGPEVEPGENVAGKNLVIRWEIDRGPKTAESFFSRSLMEKCFLTSGYAANEPIVSLESTEADRRWHADFPIGSGQSEGYQGIRGAIYCCIASGSSKTLGTAVVHYYVQYALHTQDGVLLPESTVWMAPVYPSPILNGPTADGEWFSDRPIPEITGENSSDPKLLGVPGSK